MRKIYNLLLLAVMFIASTSVVQAEKRYRVAGGNIVEGTAWSTSEIATGTQFVMQSGELMGGNPDFIRGLGKSTAITEANIFELEATGKQNEDGLDIYLLKRSFTNEYVQAGTFSYTDSKARAWEFVIKDVTGSWTNEDINNTEAPVVDDWTIATTISGPMQAQLFFVDATCVSDTAKTTKDNVKFLCSGGQGKPAAFGADFAKNTWEVFEVELLEGVDYLEDAMLELFPDDNADFYEKGDQPGQLPAELYDELQNAFQAAKTMLEEGVASQEECEAAIERCKKAIEAAKKGAVLVGEGYYYFKANREPAGGYNSPDASGNATYDDGQGLLWTYKDGWTQPEVLDLPNAKYVWHLIPRNDKVTGKPDGSYFIQNYYTKRYVGVVHSKGESVKTTEKAEETYLIYPQGKGGRFVIQSTTLLKNPAIGWGGEELTSLHCPEDHNRVVVWTPEADPSGWIFLSIPENEIKDLEGAIAQDKINQRLQALYNQANADYLKGFCFFDGNDNGTPEQTITETDTVFGGLVKSLSQLSTNRQEKSEGPLSSLLDANVASGNFFHTDWQSAVNPHELPYLQIDLGEAVNHIIVKMWARLNGNSLLIGDLPGLVNVWVTNTPEDSASWVKKSQIKTLRKWDFPETKDGVLTGKYFADTKGVAQLNAELGGDYRYVRLENERKLSNMEATGAIDTAKTFFNMSEIRVFKYAYLPEKSMIEVVDKAAREGFEKAMAAAKAELEAGKAKEETIEALDAAYKLFLESYPDPVIVRRALDEAQKQLEGATEGDQIGFFQTGAIAELQAVVDAVAAKVKDIMTLEEVKGCKAELDAAMKVFNSKLIKPADGYYYVKCETTSDQKGSAQNAYLYAGGNSSTIKWMTDPSTTGGDVSVLPQLVWKLTNKDGGIVLQNALTGEYMNNPRKNNVVVSASTVDTCAMALQSAQVKDNGFFNLVLKESVYMNAQPGTNNLVTWNAANGADNSAFSFIPAENVGEWSQWVEWPGTANKLQILTLPVDVNVAAGDGAYEVLGINDANLELKEIDGTIKGGTPFFFQGGESNFQAEVPAASTSYEDIAALWAKAPATVNGLAGTLAKVDSLHQGYGILFNGTIVDSKVGDGVTNNSGYLTPDVPKAITETGDLQVPVEGVIDAIDNVITTVPAVVNVYSLSGVKVRSNVKSANALNGLPAGVYIMGNKKVLVK